MPNTRSNGRRLTLILTSSLALAAAAAIVPSVASAAAATPPRLAPGTVVTGSVTGGGHALAGAKVTLYAWPSQAVTAAVKIGAQVPLTVLGSATSSSSGSYSIAPTNLASLRASADPNGIVNLEVLAVYHGHTTLYYFPRTLVTTAGGLRLAANSQAAKPQLAPQQANLSLNLSRRAANPRLDCGTQVPIATWNNIEGVLGAEYSHLDSVKMGFVYSTGQSSKLGAAVSSGAWSASGTYSIDGGSSQTWPGENVADGYVRYTHFTYTEYTNECGTLSTHVTNWEGSDITVAGGISKAADCQPEYAPTTVTLRSSTAWDFGGGVEISGEIGINLSAQTGYSTSLEESYDFTNTAVVDYLCGYTGPPNGGSPAPGYDVASAHSTGG